MAHIKNADVGGGTKSPTNTSYRANVGTSRNPGPSYVFDEETRTWIPPSSSPTTTTETPKKETVPHSSSSTSQVDSKTKAEKEYIEVEFNTLTGELVLISTEKTIRIKVNDTIKIEGLGKYLSGLYFVSAVKRTLNKDSGYTHTFTLLKNGFGSSLKQVQTVKEEPRVEEVPKETPQFKEGDSVKIVGDDAIYSNAHEGVKVPGWVKKKTLTISQFSSDRNRVLLMPIFSWTYVKFIQKV